MGRIKGVRLLDTTSPDSIRQLTDLLNVVYKDRAGKGADYLPAEQNEETTRRRTEGREVWVAQFGGLLAGTFTLSSPGTSRESQWFRQATVSEVSQLAVHPNFRMLGIFPILMDAAEQRAYELGAVEIAGIAVSRQKKLINAYLLRGHRIVDCKWQKNASFGIVIFSKTLRPPGVRPSFLHFCFRKLKYFRRFIRYRLLS